MRVFMILTIALALVGGFFFSAPYLNVSFATAQVPSLPLQAGNGSGAPHHPLSASLAAREEKTLQDARRQQLVERESALALKEQELKKLSDKLDFQLKAIEDAKKRLDDSRKVQNTEQKKQSDEKMLKMVKLFKTLRGEQAGKLIDAMREKQALALLSRLDTKTVAKLTPYINQPRVLKWISENLAD